MFLNKVLYLGVVFTLFSSLLWADAGFKAGAIFERIERKGYLYVTCEDTITDVKKDVIHFCHQDILQQKGTSQQTNSSLFQMDGDSSVKPQEADLVELIVEHEDGSKSSKAHGFDASSGLSTSEFQLWNKTALFPRPLLKFGANYIEYILKKKRHFWQKDQEILRGTFEVAVDFGGEYECDEKTVEARNSQDCDTSHYICQDYFKSQIASGKCHSK